MLTRLACFAAGFTLGCGGGRGASGPPVDVVVVSDHTFLGGVDVSQRLTDQTVEQIRARSEVTAVVPRAELRVPAMGTIAYDGHDLNFEVGGFTDGLPAAAVEPELADHFVEGADPVPVIVSQTLVDLYNDRFAVSNQLPHLGPTEIAIATRSDRLTFSIELGSSMVTGVERDPPWPRRTLKARVVGVSKRARTIGMSVPIGYVTAWNREIGGDRDPPHYDELTVTLRGADRVKAFAAWVTDELHLKVEKTP